MNDEREVQQTMEYKERAIPKMNDVVNNTGYFYDLLYAVTSQRQRPLTSESFLGIGQDVGADVLELMVRIPGDKDPKLLKISWEKKAHIRVPQVIYVSLLKVPIIEKVLNTGSEVIWSRG